MSNGKKLDKILNEIYEELYKRATPHSSFKELVKNADWVRKDDSGNTETRVASSVTESEESELKSNGWKRDIHYRNYRISKKSASSAVDFVLKKYKKLTDFDVQTILYNLSNGCGPLTDEEEQMENNNNK